MPGRYEKGSPPTQEDYTGHVKDESTGLHYAGARYYSAAFGQWTTTDPLADKNFADSPYAYAVNNPLRYVDPTGRDTTVETESGDEVTIKGEGEGMPSTPEEIVVTAEAPGNSQSSSASGGGASSEERTGFAERAADFGALGWASAFGTFKRLSGTSLFPNRLRPITALNPYRGVQGLSVASSRFLKVAGRVTTYGTAALRSATALLNGKLVKGVFAIPAGTASGIWASSAIHGGALAIGLGGGPSTILGATAIGTVTGIGVETGVNQVLRGSRRGYGTIGNGRTLPVQPDATAVISAGPVDTSVPVEYP